MTLEQRINKALADGVHVAFHPYGNLREVCAKSKYANRWARLEIGHDMTLNEAVREAVEQAEKLREVEQP